MNLQFQRFAAPAKLNLTLLITGKREDGYHLLDTDFRFIDFCDDIDIAVRDDGRIELETPTPGVAPEQDLAVRAARLLQQATGCPLGASLRISKRIPMGGGLGGGSSDAATVLLALNKLWACGLSRQALMDLGVQLGADVPVFIFGRNARARGIGEALEAIELPAAWYVVCKPPVSVPTGPVFQQFSQMLLTGEARFSIMRSLFGAAQKQNDLQRVVTAMYPAVNEALNRLREYGSPLMTGSGACVFLELPSEDQAKTVFQSLSKDMVGFVAKGLATHPLYDGEA
ncbi:4-(cytidine 5'-diphospho)-2-C-methyl-D-erythritol kinase [Vogesella sp. LIG4]|uniref:4-(cytidine 5'-diphospho)-2-C-methyl-D-erythritol kinase n=1 Tax=Vogesella sp. LIG4 TaxID=1192162 RepID=UPI00081FA04E|nr:4-(cytidine 5'-diphospho)-2-C-methyl-D-erythritol kinase [Vogesella sp. LIG4]SCK09615.1 4-diphosphocytidyl-2-C-methyl-D-erythritol kinase [Vogesella sp. LIG4]